MLHSTSVLPALALAATAVAQVGWVQINPATRPPARGFHSITYDITRGVTVLFGGWDGVAFFGDTWEWNGVVWTPKIMSIRPSARAGIGLAYDIARLRVVLFGGMSATGSNGDTNDTWEFDGNSWVQMQPTNQPSRRNLHHMEYDAARGRTVLFGGGLGSTGSPVYNDTWEWNGVNWTLRSPAVSPAPRWGHGMTYDFTRSRIVLFGGGVGGSLQYFSDTWTWDGTNWLQVLAPGPTPASGHGLAHDTVRDLHVRFGGDFTGTETWLFDQVVWRRDPRTATPPWRGWCALTYDLARGRTVLFGGAGTTSPFLDDTWEYDPGTVARWTTSGSGCAGTAGVPALRPVGASLPIVGTAFQIELLGIPGSAAAISFGFSNVQWNGGTLPFDLGALGMTGCTLHSNPEFLFFTPATASRATLAWALPNAASLIGVNFFNQGFALDPGINPTGATVSNAGAAVIGPF